MQNYGHGQPAYERPGSTTSFTGQPPPVPSYHQQQQWGQQPPQQQQQQAALGYNPGTYGVMPGGYAQSPQYPPTTQPSDPYAPQPHSDVPPPPPPKPYGFAAEVHKQNEQNTQYVQSTHNLQQPQQSNTGFAPQAQQGGYPVYNNAAPPPPSATPAGSYLPPSQGGRPGSIYGSDQIGAAPSPVNQRPQSTVMSPNEQAPAYIPPSLSGQGTQAYMPSNTNPMPGVYVPPPPDVPAWQQAQHAPLQGGNKRFTYTKPTVDPSFYAQGYQGPHQLQQHPQPPPLPPRYEQPGVPQQQTQQPYGQQQPPQYPPQGHAPHSSQLPSQSHVPQHSQSTQDPYLQQQQQQQQQPPAHFGQLGQPVQPLQQPLQQYNQPPVPQTYIQQQAVRLEQYAQSHQQQQVQQQMQTPVQPQPQWQAPVPAQHDYMQQQQQPAYGHKQPQQQNQQQWQPPQQPQQPALEQQYHQVLEQAIQAPKPVDRTDTTPPNFVNQSSPQSQFVSPVSSQHPSGFAPGHPTSARTDSVGSIALANLHSQRAANRTASPKPPSFKNPTPPPPRDDASRFSALGAGGPSDWQNFGAGEEIDDEELFARKPRPVQLDSVELPAHQPSSPSTQGWPSPAQPLTHAHRNDTQDTYQPTPPTTAVSPVHRTPSPKTPQQSSFAKGALVAPLRASPKPLQKFEAPQDSRHGFVMGEVLWGEPDSQNQLGNVARQGQLEGPAAADDGPQGAQVPAPVQVPPIQIPSSNTSALSVETPKQNRPGVTRFFSDVGGTWGLSPKDRERASSPWGSKDDNDLSAKLQAKDEELWRLRKESENDMQRVQADIEAGKAEFLAEIERLKAGEEAARELARKNSLALDQQVEAMKAAAEQAKLDADALKKENDLTFERIKEDIEGKEDTIKERDVTITELRAQLDDLRRQLEEEKTKELPEPPKPTARDLIPDLDPWYAGSLERYIAMLRGEASEPQVEDKIKTFQAFLSAESAIRGIEYYASPTAVPTTEPAVPQHTVQPAHDQSTSGAAAERRGLNVTVPKDSPDDNDYEYSPGGRPLLRRPTIPLEENTSAHAPNIPSSQSTAILTPASSVHDDSTPIQSPPDEQPQPQYKAYVPPIMSTDVASSLAQRKATGPSALPTVTSPSGPGKNHDEIFFEVQQPRIARADSETGGVPVVAPLNFASSRAVSMSAPPKENAIDLLKSLLPSQAKHVTSNPLIEELRTEATNVKSGSKNVEEITKLWEKTASLMRKKNADARRKRAEDNEAHNDDLFNSDEISYAELKDLEAEFKDKESKLKAQEDQDEVKSYVETVFDKVYNDLQADIAALTDLYIEAETLLQTSVSGMKSLGGGDAPTTKACLELLVEVHEQIEKTHEQIVQAVAERDKRYKKTEIQPLYTAGNKAKLKSVEKHFEEAEKQAIHRAKNEKAERMSELHKVAEDAVVGAASIEQNERSRIIAAVRDLKEGDNTDILKRASETLNLLYESSKSLLTIFNRLEIDLNTAEVEADIAQARVDGAPESKVEELQSGMNARETELKEEFARRIGVLEQDREESERLIQDKDGKVETSDEQEKEKRLKAALEEAKRRNGHA